MPNVLSANDEAGQKQLTDLTVSPLTLRPSVLYTKLCRICPAQPFLQAVFSEHAPIAFSAHASAPRKSHDIGIFFLLRGSEARRTHSFPQIRERSHSNRRAMSMVLL